MRRADKHHPLSPADHARNSTIGQVRGRVEAVFGTLKRSYRRHRLRYMGLAKNQLDLLLTPVAMNLRRARVLTAG